MGPPQTGTAAPLSTDDTARIRLAVAHGAVLPLPRILTIAQRRVPGEVLKVELGEMVERLGSGSLHTA